MPTNKETFNTNMNALANSINNVVGESSLKTIVEMNTALESIPTIIEVASEEELPTTADDGTIALIVAPPTPSGYNVELSNRGVTNSDCVDTYGRQYVKINNPPSSSNDYDYNNSSANLTDVTKIYVWTNGAVSYYQNIVFNGTEINIGNYNSYSNPYEIILSQNSTLVTTSSRGDGPCCFLANTQITTENGYANIQDIKVGDLVMTTNGLNRVNKTIINKNIIELATLALDNGQILEFNSYHPLLTIDGYKSLTNYNGYSTLNIGDEFTNGAKIADITISQVENMVGYNLVVENTNNYIANGIVAEGGK